MSSTHWFEWHAPYDDPESPLSRRLSAVQSCLRAASDDQAPGPIALVSICAGQGRDVIPVVESHPRRDDVTARLVELDRGNLEVASVMAEKAALTRIDCVVGDASVAASYLGAIPANVVLLCGVFGNIADEDIEATIASVAMLCAPNAWIIWTRHRRAPDLTPTICKWFAECGFAELSFSAPEGFVFSVGAHRLVVDPIALQPDHRFFTFVGDGSRPA